MSASSIVLLPLRDRRRPAPQSFMLGECRLRRIKSSFLVLALLVAPALGMTTAEMSVMLLAPGDAKPAGHRTSLREVENLLHPKTVSSANAEDAAESAPSDSDL